MWSAVRAFCADASQAVVATAADQIRLLVDSISDDERLRDALDKLGSEYYPPGDGWATDREWLVALEGFLRSVPADNPAPRRVVPPA